MLLEINARGFEFNNFSKPQFGSLNETSTIGIKIISMVEVRGRKFFLFEFTRAAKSV